jgi:hypothetical protein
MTANWPIWRVLGIASVVLTSVSFCGLWVCQVIREQQGLTERQFTETFGGAVAIWSLSAGFVLGLFALFPLALYFQKRAGVPLPGPNVPRWIEWPVKALMAVLVIGISLLMLMAVGAAFAKLIGR